MGNLTDELRNNAKSMMETADYINKGANYIDNGTKIAEYWLNGDKRKEINAQVAMWKKKESAMVKKYIFLWLIMISATIYVCLR